MNEAALRKELPKLKAALTRAKKSNDPQKLLQTANHALKRFEEIGFPDSWHTWNIAKGDAEFAISMGRKTLR
jgi:hypothetical protein